MSPGPAEGVGEAGTCLGPRSLGAPHCISAIDSISTLVKINIGSLTNILYCNVGRYAGLVSQLNLV